MKAISSMATRHALTDLFAAAAQAGLPRVRLESVGGVDAASRVADGELFDLVLLAAGALGRLADAGHVDAATVRPLMLSQTAAAVPDPSVVSAPLQEGIAFADAAQLRDALRSARRIGYSTGPSGTALLRMIEEWGLADELDGGLVQARSGIPVAASLSSGDVDLGFQQLSELVGQPGIRILGRLPDDCAIDTVFAGAVATASADSAGAAEVLAFLASDATVAIRRRHAFGVPA
ncbi:substrate-binding domain-containing protein [Microbacterium soli]|uniref:Molybdate ABC transporter substrate-binding protein n=1 Tax=Microbacterium soli TaxID=446075 RepID=A0ABP7N974_9MICO